MRVDLELCSNSNYFSLKHKDQPPSKESNPSVILPLTCEFRPRGRWMGARSWNNNADNCHTLITKQCRPGNVITWITKLENDGFLGAASRYRTTRVLRSTTPVCHLPDKHYKYNYNNSFTDDTHYCYSSSSISMCLPRPCLNTPTKL